MLKVHEGKQFRKDFDNLFQNASKSLKKRYKEVLTALIHETELPHYFGAHSLKGDWQDFMEGHIKSDILLIYQTTETDLYLVRIGSHSELFE